MVSDKFFGLAVNSLEDEIAQKIKRQTEVRNEIASLEDEDAKLEENLHVSVARFTRMQHASQAVNKTVNVLRWAINLILLVAPSSLIEFERIVLSLFDEYSHACNSASLNLLYPSPLELPSLPLADRNYFLSCPAVYFAYSSTQILYIGKTSNLNKRWVQHHRCAKLETFKNVKIAWLEASESHLNDIEADFIAYYKPLLNNTPVCT